MTDKQKLKDLKIAVIDTETTGLDPNVHEILEMAAIIYDPATDQILKQWSRKAAPRNIKTASDYALEINGYKQAPHSYQDSISDVAKEFYDITKDCILLGQNIQFDINFIEKCYKEFNVAKEVHRHRKLELTSIVWPIMKDTDVDSLSLVKLCEHFGVSNEGNHRALPDCHRTLEVYRCAMKTYNR